MIDSNRSLVKYIVFTILTCGIYGYWFLYQLAQDLNVICEGDGEQTPGLVEFIVFSFITCGLYAWWWYYKVGNRLANNATRYGLTFQENGTTIIMWTLIGTLVCGIGQYIAMYIIIKNTNALAAAYNDYVNSGRTVL